MMIQQTPSTPEATYLGSLRQHLPSKKRTAELTIAASAGFWVAGVPGSALALCYQVFVRDNAEEVIDFIVKASQHQLNELVPSAKDNTVAKYTATAMKAALQGVVISVLTGSSGVFVNTAGLVGGKVSAQLANTIQKRTGLNKEGSFSREAVNLVAGVAGSFAAAKVTTSVLDNLQNTHTPQTSSDVEEFFDTNDYFAEMPEGHFAARADFPSVYGDSVRTFDESVKGVEIHANWGNTVNTNDN